MHEVHMHTCMENKAAGRLNSVFDTLVGSVGSPCQEAECGMINTTQAAQVLLWSPAFLKFGFLAQPWLCRAGEPIAPHIRVHMPNGRHVRSCA